jgi:hypothetical protein
VAYRTIEDTMRKQWGARQGLEGPFNFTGRVLYYDPVEGQYYDPTTDFYVDNDEMAQIHEAIIHRLRA